jgi:hypothetical protein
MLAGAEQLLQLYAMIPSFVLNSFITNKYSFQQSDLILMAEDVREKHLFCTKLYC